MTVMMVGFEDGLIVGIDDGVVLGDAEGLSDGVSASRAPEGAGLAALGAAGEFVRTGSMLPKAFFAVSWFSASRAWRCCLLRFE